MIDWRISRISTALLVGLLPALLVGGLLVRHGSSAATAAPSPTIVRVAAILATPSPTLAPTPTPTATPALATAALTLLATVPVPPTATPTPTTIPTATPVTPTWVEVGRWRNSEVIYTTTFTVRGPWRIRWQLATPSELFQLMIEDGVTTPILLTSPTGTTQGTFDVSQGGTFSLMLHNTIPYEVIVEDFR